MSDTSEKSLFPFWSTLESILRPPLRQTAQQVSANKSLENQVIIGQHDPNTHSTNNSTQRENNHSLTNSSNSSPDQSITDEINKRLNDLKPNELVQNRLKTLEELIKLSELFNLNENLINIILKTIRDLFKIEITSLEYRKQAFEHLILFYQKKSDKFDSFLLKNHLLSFVINNLESSRSPFVNILNQILNISSSPLTSSSKTSNNDLNFSILTPSNVTAQLIASQQKGGHHGDDIKYRFSLFCVITKNFTNCKHLDPDLTIECLTYFLENEKFLTDKYLPMFELYLNMIEHKYFQFLEDDILKLLSKYILNFSFQMTNTFQNSIDSNNTGKKTFTKQEQLEIKTCVDLIDKLIDHLTIIDCINHVVLCLCELLDLTWRFQLNKSDNQITQMDTKMADTNDATISHIYECMHKLFISPIGNCAIFTFFNEIFPINKKHQIHRSHQINGALMHIKQIFDDFKQSKLKTTILIKELHLNCLIYLPNALKSCHSELDQSQKLLMFEHILNLTIDLVHLATHRDLYMCLLTFNSRKFIIEIIEQFSGQVLDNETLIQKYADLLNLLDKKEVFSYKTSAAGSKEGLLLSGSMGNSMPPFIMPQNHSSSMLSSSSSSLYKSVSATSASLKENIDENTLIFQEFKGSFYELIYNFPYAKYLKDNCINNCIDYYFQRKLLPCFGNESIREIKALLEKYFSIKKKHSLAVRKFSIEILHKRLKEYYKTDQKSFTEEVINNSLLPICELSINEDDEYYHGLNNDESYTDFIEMKNFMVLKLIDLTNYCNTENTILKIIKLFDKIISMEKTSCIELLISPQSTSLNTIPNLSSSINSVPSSINTSTSSLFYLSKIINGLIEIFEKNFSNMTNSYTRCCVEIYNILIKYLDYYYSYKAQITPKIIAQTSIALSTATANTPPPTQKNFNQSSSSEQLNNLAQANQQKYFNYYAMIRKDIFEFLLRIRSDKRGKVLLVNKMNRKKFLESKYLMLTLNETKIMLDGINNDQKSHLSACQIDIGKVLKMIENCLDKELDWNVLIKVLADSPYMLQYEMNLIKSSEFISNSIKYFFKKDINVFRNKPDNLVKLDYIAKFYPLIASLILYHSNLDRSSQEGIFQAFLYGLNPNRNRYCIEILTIAIIEMHETNSNNCGDILVKLSQFSPSQIMALPVLELLSIMSDFNRIVDYIFSKKELYISVLAIAIKYTNPLKFNSFVIQLAHYVICVWFLKSKHEIRKSCASFISKGLYKEVIHEIEQLKETKSPNKPVNEIEPQNSQTSSQQITNLNNNLNASQISSLNASSNLNKEPKAVLTEALKTFYKELVELTIDFMSNNMFFDNSTNSQLNSLNNHNQIVADIYSLSSVSTSSNYLRVNSLLDTSSQSKSNIQTRQWLIGNKMIQIKTGLYYNICQEDLVRKRVNSVNKEKNTNALNNNKTSPSTTKQTIETQIVTSSIHSKLIPTSAIDIPTNPINKASPVLNSALNNDSIASSNNSSTSVSNNNSYSSVSLTSNVTTPMSTVTDASNLLSNENLINKNLKNVSEKNADNLSVNSLNGCNKSEQDFFDETIDSSDPNLVNNDGENKIENGVINQINPAITQTIDDLNSLAPSLNEITLRQNAKNNNMADNGAQIIKRNRLKRRYKSGLPLTTDRNESDINEDLYLKEYFDYTMSKQSKDDSAINSDSTLLSGICCLKNASDSGNRNSNAIESEFHDFNHRLSNHPNNHHHHQNSQHSNHYHHHHHHHRCHHCLRHHKKDKLSNDETNKNKELCSPDCWCNNLVEITCRYPTKVVSYVSLIETNYTNSHSINLDLFEKLTKLNKFNEEESNETQEKISNNQTADLNKENTANLNKLNFSNMSLARIAANAVELRKSALARISESSSTHENPNATTSPTLINDSQQKTKQLGETINSPIKPDVLALKRNSLTRKSSIDSNLLNLQSNNNNNEQQTSSIISPKNPLNKIINTLNTNSLANQTNKQLDPSQVFLQLFQSQQFYNEEKDQPLLIPETDAIKRSMDLLDFLPCYMVHKIGVIYIGPNQANDEKAILSNANGSYRYKNFIRGLGNLICLKDIDTKRFYAGGLENDDSSGDFTILWQDGIAQVVFHVSTMMIQKEENCISKKRHIGNDSTIIVYNESGEDYEFGAIKGEVNCVCIEINPLKSNTNIVKIKTTSELEQSQLIKHNDPKFLSDNNLGLIVRKMALHADIASRVFRSQKEGVYGGKWYERLKQINRIKRQSKEYYAKIQSKPNPNNNSPKISAATTTAGNPSQNLNNQLDFTNYI